MKLSDLEEASYYQPPNPPTIRVTMVLRGDGEGRIELSSVFSFDYLDPNDPDELDQLKEISKWLKSSGSINDAPEIVQDEIGEWQQSVLWEAIDDIKFTSV